MGVRQGGWAPRQPLLSKDVLNALKEDLIPLWDEGLSAEEIADRLEFGKYPYEDLKTYHVWYYRKQFGCQKRKGGIEKGKPRYNVKPDVIEPPTIQEIEAKLNEVYPLLKNNAGATDLNTLMVRAYIWLHRYSPLRKSEIYERELGDFYIDEKAKILTLQNFIRKKKLKGKAKEAPFLIPLDYPHVMDEIVTYLVRRIERTQDSSAKAFPMSGWVAWNRMKKAFPDMYPHYWRFKYITESASDPNVPIEDLLADTDLNLLTLRRYMMTGERQRLASLQRRKQRELV
jgi:hypothetical protein